MPRQEENTQNQNPQEHSLSSFKTEEEELTLTAYSLEESPSMRLISAFSTRSWMANTSKNFASRCLPLLIANQAGWFILNDRHFRAIWDGNNDSSGVQIEYTGGPCPYPAVSHFGYGIITWNLPYLFRTSSGYNLLVRGPANWPKDSIAPLEGIVETDWANATFTMNWKFTRSNQAITFEVDEPICMLIPQKRGELEAFKTNCHNITSELNINEAYNQWYQERDEFLTNLGIPGSEASRKEWQKDYFRGCSPGGFMGSQHQIKLHLQDFVTPKDIDDVSE